MTSGIPQRSTRRLLDRYLTAKPSSADRGRLLLALVCHCEPIWWDEAGTAGALPLALDSMRATLEDVGAETGKPTPTTLCLTFDHSKPSSQTARSRLKPLTEWLDRGHEIGVHTCLAYDQVGHEAAALERFIAHDAQALIKLGFPPPRSWVGGYFYTTAGTVGALESAGFTVDCSVSPYDGALYHANTGKLYADYLDLDEPRPYRAARGAITRRGTSRVIELPVSGYLPELAWPDDPKIRLPRARTSLRDRFKARWETRRQVDVFHVFWHPFELVRRQQGRVVPNGQLIDAVRAFLIDALNRPGVEMATAASAAQDWEAVQNTVP
jgi:hypothetical protein